MLHKKIVVETLSRCKEPALLYSIFFLPSFVLARIPTGNEFNDPTFLLSTTLIGLLHSALIIYLLQVVGSRKFERYGLGSIKIGDLGWGIVGLVLLWSVFGFVFSSLRLLPPCIQESIMPPFQWKFTQYGLIPLLLAALWVGAFFEELFFRGYLFEELNTLQVSRFGAVFFVTLVFALGHGYQGVWGILLAFLLGCILMILRIQRGSIWASTISHFLYNTTVLFLYSFTRTLDF